LFTPSPLQRGQSWTDARPGVALGVFVIFEIVAALAIVLLIGSDNWFSWYDDKDFLVDRDATDIKGLFEPHFGHWTTLPILVYRALFNLFGLNYTAFLIVLVFVHLTTAALLRCVMRRAGVGAWTATTMASVLVLYGPGGDNILWSFQITFVGAMAFGLTQLLLADHDGALDHRDAAGLVAGAAALMCSAVGPLMVVAVGAAVFVRRGWRMALFHAGPLAALFGAWYFAHADAMTVQNSQFQKHGFEPVDFVLMLWQTTATMARSFGGGNSGPVVLLVALTAGLVLVWKNRPQAGWWASASMPLGMLAAAVTTEFLLGLSRPVFFKNAAVESRYMYLLALLVLPTLAVAVEAIARRWMSLGVILMALAIFSIAYNATTFNTLSLPMKNIYRNPDFYDLQKTAMVQLARSPLADQVPAWVTPYTGLFGDTSIGWMLHVRDTGRLPRLDEPDARQLKNRQEFAGTIPFLLGFSQARDTTRRRQNCTEVTTHLDLDPEPGDSFEVYGRATVTPQAPAETAPAFALGSNLIEHLIFKSAVYETTLPNLHVRLSPALPGQSFTYCPR